MVAFVPLVTLQRVLGARDAVNGYWVSTTSRDHGLIDATTTRIEDALAAHGYQVGTEAVFQQGVARIGQPSGLQLWQAGRVSTAEHQSFTTRFAAAYDNEIQRWVDAVCDGRLVDGPNAWDGYLVALACEAGVRALEGGIHTVDAAERPAFYA